MNTFGGDNDTGRSSQRHNNMANPFNGNNMGSSGDPMFGQKDMAGQQNTQGNNF